MTPEPICPGCGMTTFQLLRGWLKGCYTSYRCGHCNKAYKVMQDREEVEQLEQKIEAIQEWFKDTFGNFKDYRTYHRMSISGKDVLLLVKVLYDE